jgi:heptosyltransferase I
VWDLRLTPSETAARDEYFASFDRPVCGLVAGTSRADKNWQPSGYARVIEALTADFGMTPLLLGGPSAGDQEAAHEIRRLIGRPVSSALGRGVRRLLWLLSGCDLVISPDTGPLHISRALDVPTIGLYGFTNPKRTGPYRRFTELVVDGFALSEGEEYGIDSPNRPGGMNRVTPEQVLAKVDLARRLYPRQAGPART